MNQNHSFKIPVSLLLLQASVITVFWLILSWNNRLVHDDLLLLKTVHEQGVIGATIHFWEHWNTRWASLLWINCWYNQWDYHSHPYLYHIITYCFLVGSFYALLKSLEKKYFIRELKWIERLAFSIICFAGLIASTYNIGDTWFWVNTSAMYGWNLGCIVYALAILLSNKKKIHIISLSILGLYIGGASELPAVLISMGSILLFIPSNYKKLKPDYRFFVFQLLVLVGFLIAYSGSGHSIRSEALPHLDLFNVAKVGIYSALKIAMYKSPIRLINTVLLLLPLYSLLPIKSEDSTTALVFFKHRLIPVFIFWIFIVCCHAFIITKLMGDAGPERAWSGISLVSVLSIGWLLIKTNEIGFRVPLLKLILILTTLAISGLCIQQWRELKLYSTALEERMQVLVSNQTSNESDTLFFNALPQVQFLHNADPGFTKNGSWVGMKKPVVITDQTSE